MATVYLKVEINRDYFRASLTILALCDGGNTILGPQTNAAGRVGIGTSNPTAKLDVSGAARVGGTLTAASGIASGGAIDMGGTGRVINVADPTSPQDLATKAYVDRMIAAALSGQSPGTGKGSGTGGAVYNCGSCVLTTYTQQQDASNYGWLCYAQQKRMGGVGVCSTPSTTYTGNGCTNRGYEGSNQQNWSNQYYPPDSCTATNTPPQ